MIRQILYKVVQLFRKILTFLNRNSQINSTKIQKKKFQQLKIFKKNFSKVRNFLSFFERNFILYQTIFYIPMNKYIFFSLTSCRAVTGVIVFLMICAVIYDNQNFANPNDSESHSSVSNNNDQQRTFVDKHLEERRITVNCQDNDKEFIDKLENGTKLTMIIHAKPKQIQEKGDNT